jgi:hypothetical protein
MSPSSLSAPGRSRMSPSSPSARGRIRTSFRSPSARGRIRTSFRSPSARGRIRTSSHSPPALGRIRTSFRSLPAPGRVRVHPSSLSAPGRRRTSPSSPSACRQPWWLPWRYRRRSPSPEPVESSPGPCAFSRADWPRDHRSPISPTGASHQESAGWRLGLLASCGRIYPDLFKNLGRFPTVRTWRSPASPRHRPPRAPNQPRRRCGPRRHPRSRSSGRGRACLWLSR